MKGQRRFLECTAVDSADRNTVYGAFRDIAIPVVSIKEIVPWDGTEQSEHDPWKFVQAKVYMKDGSHYHTKQSVAELVKQIELPYA